MAGGQEKNKAAAASGKKYQKSYFDVMGICCSSEVPLIENILKPLDGVKEISVIVASRTVIVVHDNLLISQLQIVKALNQARLEANVRVHGESNFQKKWPSLYATACGILLLLSLLKYVYKPFQWLALCAVAVGIFPIALRGLAAIRNFRLDINILMLIAVVGTIALNDYLEAGTIVFLFTIAEWLESRASHKATAIMSSLMSIAPQKAVIAETGEAVDADEVKVNTILAVKAGEVIPIDGIVVDGKCEVDEKTLTGESFPVAKQKDSTVWAGTINLNGYVTVKTTEIAEDCVVAKMVKMVEEAQNNKSKTQRFIDRCAQYYTPAVVIISACFAAIPAAMRLHNLNQWFHLALVILVSACPCALILSTPVATFCALSKAATSGLLIKGGDYLEVLAKIKVMAFDKTGTITRGEFIVSDFRPLCDEISLNTLLYWVSSIESKSSHPMAVALVDYGRSVSIEPKPEKVKEYQNFPGEGIYGKIDAKDIFIGNRKIAQRAGCQTVPTPEDNTKQGKTTGYIYSGATPAGIFSLSDACRTGVAEAIKELKLLGIKSVMLTGDSNAAALHAQEQLGNALDVVHSELLPEDKAAIIKGFKEGPKAMVGDGLNDAPALATADIGISMGISGSALATETGNIILMSNDIRQIPKAVKLARNAHRKVIQNVILSITTKVAILALAFTGHPLIWAAVLADVGTCLLVILNSMLLLRETHKHGGKCSKSSAASHNHNHGCHTSNSHSSHAHQHCCSNRNTTKACETQNCTAQGCGSSSQSGHFGSTSCENDKCTDLVEMHDGCVDDFHEAKNNHKHGCLTSNCHSFNAHQHCCSNRNAKKACEPQNCTAQRCGSSRQSGHFGSRLCENDKRTDSVERHDGCVGDFHEATHSEHGSCNMNNHDMELCHLHKHGCSGPHILSSCTKDKCTDSIEGQGNCVEGGGLGEGKHCDHGGCDKVITHDSVSHSRPKHINHSTTLGENHSVSQPITHNGHCHLAHCGENKLKNYINNKAVGNTVESCCNNQQKNLEVHCGFKNHDTDNNEKPHMMIDIVLDSDRVESSAMHACINLEKREIGGCCKSYRKECCGEHGHLGAGFGGGGLSEIITE